MVCNIRGYLRNGFATRASIPISLLLLPSLGCGSTPDKAASHASATAADAGGSNLDDAVPADTAQAADASGTTCSTTAPVGDTVSIAAATFPMGCAMGDTACKDDEKPEHAVTLNAFEIDRTEVTQGAYTACVQAQACRPPSCAWDCSQTHYPAHCIERSDAEAFCSWAGKRLPSEAEWEMAARGTDGRIYPWGNQPPDCTLVNMEGCDGHADSVGAHPNGASPYGALDMEGNVVEMVSDWYDATYYQGSPSNEPTGPATGTRYVGRGGGYKSAPVWQRASQRDWYDPPDQSQSLGFRCAR